MGIVTLQGRRPASGLGLESGEGQWQFGQRAAEEADIVGLAQVSDKRHLGWLVLHVAAQMGTPDTAAQALLGAGEELLQNVVGAGHNRHYAPLLVVQHRLAAELGA